MNCRLVSFLSLLAAVFVAGFTGVSSIQVSHVTVPHQVGRGHDAQLHCHFNLGGNRLYSVKWYKGSSEFFRVVHPDGGLPSPVKFQVFPHLSNLTVDVQRSNTSTVYLKNIQRSYAGSYRCEVSGESPYFETDFKDATMSVIDLPLQGPIIINVQTSYQPGERVSLNCTSAPSNPMAILQWSVDGEMVSEPHVKRYMDGSVTKPTARSAEFSNRHNGRENEGDFTDENVATVGLEFAVELPKLSTGAFAVRQVSCTAFVGDIYRSVTLANLSIADGRFPKTIATVRTPSHLLHSSASGSSGKCWSLNSTYWIGLVFYSLFHLLRQHGDQ